MNETKRTLGMKKNTPPKIIALIFAIMAHLLILHLWLVDDEATVIFPSNAASQSNFEISLLPQNDATSKNTAPSIQQDTESTKNKVGTNTPASAPLIDTKSEAPLSDVKDFTAWHQSAEMTGGASYPDKSDNLTDADADQTKEPRYVPPKAGHETVDTETEFTDLRKIEKPTLLDVKIDEHKNTTNSATEKVFSPTLKEQITSSQKTQKEYLKTQTKETRYPITEDADGTRYVNIKGVCWRIPKDNQKEEWTVVLSGCGGQTKTFLFELSIAPDILGADSPFNLPQ
ncbi:hypothetical protein [Marinomonas sp.]